MFESLGFLGGTLGVWVWPSGSASNEHLMMGTFAQ